MCGRYSASLPPEQIGRLFGVDGPLPNFPARYNLAPTQDAPVVRRNPKTQRRQVDLLRWGLIPSWAKESKVGNSLINARAETIATKPAFRTAFARGRRCLVAADGFYEWKKSGNGLKQPWRITMKGGAPFAFAGLWENWRDPAGHWIRTFTIITTEPNELMRPIHIRMPVIIAPENYAHWLGERDASPDFLLGMCAPYPAEEMTAYPVSTRVNSPKSEGPELIKNLAEL